MQVPAATASPCNQVPYLHQASMSIKIIEGEVRWKEVQAIIFCVMKHGFEGGPLMMSFNYFPDVTMCYKSSARYSAPTPSLSQWHAQTCDPGLEWHVHRLSPSHLLQPPQPGRATGVNRAWEEELHHIHISITSHGGASQHMTVIVSLYTQDSPPY